MTGKEVLRAIADGAHPSEFEYLTEEFPEWNTALSLSVGFLFWGQYEFRRKPRTRVVNGFTVPAPIQEMPKECELVWRADPSIREWSRESWLWVDSEGVPDNVQRGLLFSTKEAAIANAKAMCGISPDES